jgi:hypothetical protein
MNKIRLIQCIVVFGLHVCTTMRGMEQENHQSAFDLHKFTFIAQQINRELETYNAKKSIFEKQEKEEKSQVSSIKNSLDIIRSNNRRCRTTELTAYGCLMLFFGSISITGYCYARATQDIPTKVASLLFGTISLLTTCYCGKCFGTAIRGTNNQRLAQTNSETQLQQQLQIHNATLGKIGANLDRMKNCVTGTPLNKLYNKYDALFLQLYNCNDWGIKIPETREWLVLQNIVDNCSYKPKKYAPFIESQIKNKSANDESYALAHYLKLKTTPYYELPSIQN